MQYRFQHWIWNSQECICPSCINVLKNLVLKRDTHFSYLSSLMSIHFLILRQYICLCCCQVASVVSDSVRPHGQQPTRLLRPWDSPGKNTGVGCHFLLQCMKVESESEVTQSCLTLSYPIDCCLPGSSIHGIFRATVLEWGAIAFSPEDSATAKSRQSCLTLCDPIDSSPPGSTVPGILQARILEWVAISFSIYVYVCP